MVIGIIIGAVVLILIIWFIAAYNGFVRLKNSIEEAFSTMDVYLKKRYDLIPNLVETVKGYAKHEKETLERVIAARNAAASATTLEGRVEGENALQSTLKSLFAIAEAYPDLKASANFQQLQTELSDIENKIAAARRFFNNAVQEYNTGIQSFPAVLVAGSLGFHQREFFDLGDARPQLEQAPQVKF